MSAALKAGALRFEERMSGWISFAERDYNQAAVEGRAVGRTCEQRLSVEIEDVGRFLSDRDHSARAEGVVDCAELGGALAVTDGSVELFAPYGVDPQHRRLRYRLLLESPAGVKLTLSGFKDAWHGPGLDGWGDTSRLLIRVFAGHHLDDPHDQELIVATGILHLTTLGFARQIASMFWHGGADGIRPVLRFGSFFASELWKLYARRAAHLNDEDWPDAGPLDPRWQGQRPGQWHELDARPGALERRIVGFRADDGAQGTLHNIRRHRDDEPEKGPVIVLHGCSVRANMFYGAPTKQTVVEALLDAGYDVWLENWRGSIDLPATMWTLDDAGAFDHPAAVRSVLERTGAHTLKALVHCQGSTSFMMSVLAGLVPEVTHVVSNAVSLHVEVTPVSKLRLLAMPPVAARFLRGVDPQWTARAPTSSMRRLGRLSARRRMCDSDVCRSANFYYGVGPEALWLHANLDEDTHTWNNREWGFCPFSFFKQMGQCALAGHLVPSGAVSRLPDSFTDVELADISDLPRFTFMAGSANTCFLPSSQERTWRHFEERDPGRHHLRLLPGYSHLDVFIGRDAHRDVYPHIVSGLEGG